MNQQKPEIPPRSVISRAAHNGLAIGLYLIVLLLAMGAAMGGVGVAGLVWWAGSIYLPFLVYRFLRASNAECGFSLGIPELWAEGIAAFFLGGLFPALLAYVLLKFAFPHFLPETYQMCIDSFRSMGTPEWTAWADSLERIRQHQGVPQPADVVAQIISMNLMGGMVISMIDAVWLKIRYMSHARRARYSESRKERRQL